MSVVPLNALMNVMDDGADPGWSDWRDPWAAVPRRPRLLPGG